MAPTLSVVVAVTDGSADVRQLIGRAERWATVGGARAVVVAGDAGVTGTPTVAFVHHTGSRGSAWAAAFGPADGQRVLLLDGRCAPTDDEVRAHREQDIDVLAVPVIAGLPPSDLAVAFAIQGGAGTSGPTAQLQEAAAATDDVVAAHRAARALQPELTLAPMPPLAGRAALDPEIAGRDAIRLQAAQPDTLSGTGLGSFREVPYPAYVARRVLVRLPSLARVFAARGPAAVRPAASDALFWCGVRTATDAPTWRSIRAAVPILMYHAFTDGDDASRYVLPTRQLDRQLRLLRRLGRTVLSLDDYLEARTAFRFVPAGSVVLTIDDGYADTYEVAAEIFARHRAPATIFVPSARVGGTNDWSTEAPLAGRPLATAAQLRAGREQGIAVGSHARTHPVLPELPPEEAIAEIEGARRELSELVGAPVTTFAYPFGAEDDNVRSMVLEAGYAASCSSRGGPNPPAERLDSLRRIEVRGGDPLWRFALAILTGSARPVRAFRQQWGT